MSDRITDPARRAPRNRWVTVARGALAISAFVGGLAATAALTARVAGRSPVPEFTAKLGDVAAKRANYDVLFLGSSRVRRQISPAVFDETLAAAGLRFSSYNFGLDGLGFPEILYVADEILASKPRKLKYVVLELTRFAREFGPLLQPDSPRTIYWHTLPLTMTLCRAIWEDPAGPSRGERISLMSEHLEICLQRGANVGRGTELMGVAAKQPNYARKMGPAGDGFFPVKQEFPAAQRSAYAKQIADLRERLRQPATPEPVYEETTLELLRKFKDAGVTPIIVTMPRIHPSTPWVPASEVAAVFEFHDPDKNADLFETRLHYDAQHLNSEGATVFSRQLAEHFAGFIRAKEGGKSL